MGKAAAYRELKKCECRQCGIKFEVYHKRIYCSNTCSERSRSATGRSREDIHAELRATRQRTCQHCGKDYIKKKGAGNPEGGKYCSRECAWAASKGIGKKIWGEYCEIEESKYTAIEHRECIVCDRIHYGRVSTLAICSNECVIIRTEEIRRDKQKKAVHECPGCGVRYCRINGSRIRFCVSCADERHKMQRAKQRKTQNHARRARKNGVNSDNFDPLLVLDRDGWQCQGCGCDTPKALRGTSHDDAPELDHVVPLAKGGEHTMNNTQCLCRTCNIFKSDMTMSEYVQWNQ